MANLPPGDPKLVSQIVSHLKSQGLFDQFRRDCLADVDTKPAYQNLRQRVDNFVTNHLASHTWSPHLNKNQLRNNIRQQVLKSGMLESGIDRIISQVVDPKINHTFRPQVEKVVQEFLASLNSKEEVKVTLDQHEERFESSTFVPGTVATVGPSTSVASDAMSILETISSLNQEATAARAFTETTNHKNEKAAKKILAQQSIDAGFEKDRSSEEPNEAEKPRDPVVYTEVPEPRLKQEDLNDVSALAEEVKICVSETVSSAESNDAPNEAEEQKLKAVEKSEKKIDTVEKTEHKEEKKESRLEKRSEHPKKSDDAVKLKEEEKSLKEREHEPEQMKPTASEKSSSKQKATDGLKEDSVSVDSDIDAYSDITVSSVHTSDLSSFEEESDEETAVSDSTEEGEITSDDEEKVDAQSKSKSETDQNEAKPKTTRHSYVHKPFLYSKYYSDSDDELTVEQRRQAAAKEKEERLLRRQLKREKLEEKRRLKAVEKKKALKIKSQGIEQKSIKSSTPKTASIKEVLKEQMFLEKKVALSKKRKRDSRAEKTNLNLKGDIDEDSRESQKTSETSDKTISSTKEAKPHPPRSDLNKPSRKLTESDDSRSEREHRKKTPLQTERTQQDTETRESKKLVERHDSASEDQQKQKNVAKSDKHLKREVSESEMQSTKNTPKKDPKLHKIERERSFSEDRLSSRHRSKSESVHKGHDDTDQHKAKRKDDDIVHKRSQSKSSSEERSDRKSKPKSDGKSTTHSKEDRTTSTEHKYDDNSHKDSCKRERHQSSDKSKSEHRYKRSLSDSRQHRDSQNSARPHSTSQRKSKSQAEDKNEAESANSDSNSKFEDGINKDKRRTPSTDERVSSKAQIKNSKSVKKNDQEDATQKTEKDKNYVGSSLEKHRKLKSDDKDSENRMDSSIAQTSNSLAKESSHKSKHSGEKPKERSQSEHREHPHSKFDKKYLGENDKSSNSRQSQKDIKRKDDGRKCEDKQRKSVDDKRSQERDSSLDIKSSKKAGLEVKGETSKSSATKKSSNLEHENDGADSAGERGKVSTSSFTIESKEEINSSNAVRLTESAKSRPTVVVELKEVSEPVTTDSVSASDSPALNLRSETSKELSLKSKSKQGVTEPKTVKLSSASRNVSPIIPTLDFHATKNLITLTLPSDNARKRMPGSNTAGSASDSANNSKNSLKKSRSAVHNQADTPVSQTSGDEQQDPVQEPSGSGCSRPYSVAVLPELTVLNDSEISTSDNANQEEKHVQEQLDISESSGSKPKLPAEILELDNTVTGNDVEEGSVTDMDVAVTENNENVTDFDAEGRALLGATCNEGSVQSSILETNTEETSGISLTYSKTNVPSSRTTEDINRVDCEDAATSSSTGVNAATSSYTPVANSRTDNTNSDNVMGRVDNLKEFTASTSADVENFYEDADATMLSDNSFEDATTSSSTYKTNRIHGDFSDVPLSSEKCRENTATSSQNVTDVSPEDEGPSGSSTLSTATSSFVNRASSGISQDNAATSSDSNTSALGVSENVITRVATSSDNTAESDSAINVPENGIMHATSSDSIAESDAVQSASENVISHSATSSDSASESDDGAPRVSENVISHAATSSSSVVNSSRGLNTDVSVASSETDNENTAASSSNFMDSIMSNSMVWHKHSSERDENAASSSSSVPRNGGTEHKNLNFANVEDSKNASATSSTQHDGSFDDRCMEVMSSGTLKEYPVNSSDIGMDSSTEPSISITRGMYSGNASSCSSSGRAQSQDDEREFDHEKSKENNTASSSSVINIAGSAVPCRNGSDEAASSSSSSYMDSHTLLAMDNATVGSENTEATASSSFSMNSSTQRVDISSLGCPGNSSDNAASSSSNSRGFGATDVHETHLINNTHATTSSNITMDSSTEEDMDLRCVRNPENRSNTATSSSTLNPMELNVGISEKDIGVSASSSSVAGNSSNENHNVVLSPEKVTENAATSSDMMDSSTENNNCSVLSNNTVCATTSTSNSSEMDADKDMDGSFSVCCEINSEATAASSSNTMDNTVDNATSSNYMMHSRPERENVSQTTCLDKNEEAASSSGLFSGVQLQEARSKELIVSETIEGATSSERPSELVGGSRMTDGGRNENNETGYNIVEGAAQSSLAASRSSNASITVTSEEALHLAPSTNVDAELVINSDRTNNVRRDEKEDAVSSASSEEQKICSNNSRPDSGETDGAVTSVGTEVSESSMINENCEAFGHVTFVHLSGLDVGHMDDSCPEEDTPVSHNSNVDVNESSVSETNVDNRVAEESESGLSLENRHETEANLDAEPDPERLINDTIVEEGEGAVTSTGITEENYVDKLRRGLRESDSSCSCTEIDRVNVLNRQETRDLNAVTEDDESAITSTGAKEDEDDGEGFVTSTGTASEDSSFSTGTEENSNSGLKLTIEKGSENVSVYNKTVKKEMHIDQSGSEETTQSISLTSDQELLPNKGSIKSTEEMDIVSAPGVNSVDETDTISEQCQIHTGQALDTCVSEHAESQPENEQVTEPVNTLTQDEVPAEHEQTLTNEDSLSSERSSVDVVSHSGKIGVNRGIQDSENVNSGQSNSENYIPGLEGTTAVGEPVSSQPANDARSNTPKSERQSSSEVQEDGSVVTVADMDGTSTTAIEGILGESSSKKTEDKEKKEDSSIESRTEGICHAVLRDKDPTPAQNPIVDLSTPSEETSYETSYIRNLQEPNSEVANEEMDVSLRSNECKEESEAAEPNNTSSSIEKEGDSNVGEEVNFKPVKSQQINSQETPAISEGESAPTVKELCESSAQEVDHKDEERTFETIQPESIPLIEPAKQDTEPQSSEENEESISVKAKKSTGRKPLVKVKDEGAKVNEEIEKKSSPNLKTDEGSEHKTEQDKRKRGRPPKKRKLSETLSTESTFKNKGSSEESSPEDQDKHQENTNGSKATSDSEKAEKSDLDGTEKNAEPIRRRGRKPKSSISSSETESSEPEKKRRKSQSDEEEQNKEESEEEDEDEDEHKGATTRAASRLEAQRKLPHKPTTRAASKLGSPEPPTSKDRRRKEKSSESPSNRTTNLKSKTPQAHGAKRRREASPLPVRTRGQQSAEDVPAKRIKRH
ncbi:biorientation of chromosomes in cell division protein 1-like 1 [Pelobates fuscus]|uniref:biorientation of chromosomes in cell division protein 1-like 1 n=1 Tax=Pelobates fuscus TaxID=191477 RepID=UPI002FE4423F